MIIVGQTKTLTQPILPCLRVYHWKVNHKNPLNVIKLRLGIWIWSSN